MKSESLTLEIWDRLLCGSPLKGLPVDMKDGRADLSALLLPEPSVVRKYQMERHNVTEIEPAAVFRGIKWRDLDFTGSKLKGIRFFDSEIRNCVFDKCDLEGLRMWSTTIADSSFRGANLKTAVLGGVQDGRRNTFSQIDFSDADMRGTIYKAACFENCVFRGTKLARIDFQTSTFVDCLFEGELNDVLFYRCGFQGEAFPPNEMINVDFSRAKLRHVGFRGLALDRVTLPQDVEHIVIRNFTRALDKMIDELNQQEDSMSKKLVAFLQIDRKWAPENRAQGVINLEDLKGVVGEEGVRRLIGLLSENK